MLLFFDYNIMLKNISTDVEYSWDPVIGRWQGSILSLWSCELWNINNTFYSEIQPINDIYNNEAMGVITPGFKYIGETQWLWASETLELLKKYGDTPEKAFWKYRTWLEAFWDVKLREIACPIKFDGGLSSYYFRKFEDVNPLNHTWEDGNSMLRGFLSDQNMSFRKLGIEWLGWELPHNALIDSQIQSIWIEFLLKLMQKNTQSHWELSSCYLKYGENVLLESNEVRWYVDWVRDSVPAIRNTPFGQDINYRSIL